MCRHADYWGDTPAAAYGDWLRITASGFSDSLAVTPAGALLIIIGSADMVSDAGVWGCRKDLRPVSGCTTPDSPGYTLSPGMLAAIW